jgi:hypothetical protein
MYEITYHLQFIKNWNNSRSNLELCKLLDTFEIDDKFNYLK